MKDVQNIHLKNGGEVIVYPDFLNKEDADKLFDLLMKDVPWNQEKSRWGVPVPRLNAWYAEKGVGYSYSGISHEGKGWHPECEKIKEEIELRSKSKFNSLLLNLYRDGNDSIGLHTDSEPSLGKNPIVASLSLGATRRFSLRHMKDKEGNNYLRHNMTLNHGELLVMAGTLQHHWLHELPKEPGVKEPRISLTFRNIIK